MSGRFLPIASLIIAGALFFIYINPTYTGKIKAAQAAIASDNVALADAADYAAKANQLASERSAIPQDSMDKLNAFLPDSVSNVQIILDLNSLASRSGVTLAGINADVGNAAQNAGGISTDNSPLGTLDMRMTVNGTYAAFRTFLTGIESSQRLLDVRTLSVKSSDTGVYTYDLTVRIYWLR